MPSGLPRASFSYVTRLTPSTRSTHSTTRLTRLTDSTHSTTRRSITATTRPSNHSSAQGRICERSVPPIALLMTSLDSIDSLTRLTRPHADANPVAVTQLLIQKQRPLLQPTPRPPSHSTHSTSALCPLRDRPFSKPCRQLLHPWPLSPTIPGPAECAKRLNK